MTIVALIAALPWIAVPMVAIWRARGDPSLDDESASPPPDPPLVSVIIPARNEASNIADCIQAVLGSAYPALEIIVVDDHSDDDTGGIARAMGARHPRVRAIAAREKPNDWFGKQWACAEGAAVATGAVLCFTDADTRHGRELLTRSVNAMRARALDLVSVLGRQTMGSFWERLVQPQVFAMLTIRFGGAAAVNRARKARDKLANGQFLLIARAPYDELNGHAAVRDLVAEDLGLAQLFYERGKRTELLDGRRHLSTRMYTSLRTIVRGWMKNIYAGARAATPFGGLGQALLPILLALAPLFGLVPPVVLLLALAGVASPAELAWSAIATSATLAWWVLVYATTPAVGPRRALRYAAAYPLGSLVLELIILRAVIRGRHVEWRGRRYIAR